MNPESVTIYVQLLNEGLVTARPVQAQPINDDKYRILKPADYNPEDEEWEFVPGTVVRCEDADWGEGKTLFLAVEKAE